MEASKILKEKKFWIASFLVAWAAGLQAHMMWMKKQDAFKQKFGDPDDKKGNLNSYINVEMLLKKWQKRKLRRRSSVFLGRV